MVSWGRTPARARFVVASVSAVALGAVVAGPARVDAGVALSLALSGSTATATQPLDERTCRDGSSNSRRLQATAPVQSGVLGRVPGTAGLNLDVAAATATSSYLGPDAGQLAVTTERGELVLTLTAGTCAAPALTGTTRQVSGSATWAVDAARTTGGYAGATGTGTSTLAAELEPGARNAWSLGLGGELTVLQPTIAITWVRSYWGRLGAGFTGRRATVVYRVTNTGPGRTYGAALQAVGSPVDGITAPNFTPIRLGDLRPGESTDLTVHFKLDAKGAQGPLVTRRELRTSLTYLAPDVLDQGSARSVDVTVLTPSYPPAL